MFKIIKNRIFIAVFLAVITLVLSYRLLISITERVNVVVMVKEVQAFEVVSDDAVSYRLISKADRDTLFPNAISDKAEIVGAIAKERIPAGTVLQSSNMFIIGETAKKMIGVDNKVEPKYLIPEGFRVVAVSVDNEGSVGSIITKNDLVDVVYTSRDQSTGGIYSKTILQQVPVFDIQSNQDQTLKNTSVVLLVKPEDVPMLVTAKRNGTIDLVLNPNDPQTYTDIPFHIADMTPPNVRNRNKSFEDIMDLISANKFIPSVDKNSLYIILTRLQKYDTLRDAVESSDLSRDQKDRIYKILDGN